MGEYFKLHITDSVKDSKPYFEKKDVILCRSGIQEYTYAEVQNFGLSNPKIIKDVYKVYRPANVLIATKDKMANLPITKEHPPDFIDGENWQRYAHGYTGSEVDIISLGEGEIGIKSSLIFSTSDVYNYYLEGNQEVSLGYVSKNAWVDNPDKTGYDIIMVDIEDVNHLAVTAAGRGGSRVAVIDSILGGITMFKTGLFHFLKTKGKTTDASTPFSKIVFDSLEKAKTMDEKKLESEVKRVMDSLVTLKESESKTLLMDSVTDCYKAIDTALENKDSVGKFIDSIFAKAEKETLDSIASYGTKDSKDDEEEEGVKDSEEEEGVKDSEEEEGVKDEDGKGTGTKNVSDTAFTADSMKALVQDALSKNNDAISKLVDAKVASAVKEALGIDDKDNTSGGSTQDSASDLPKVEIDLAKYVL